LVLLEQHQSIKFYSTSGLKALSILANANKRRRNKMNKKSKKILKFLFLIISISFFNLSAMKEPLTEKQADLLIRKIQREEYENWPEIQKEEHEDWPILDKLMFLFSSTKKTLNSLRQNLEELSSLGVQAPVEWVRDICKNVKKGLDRLKELVLLINFYINGLIEDKRQEIKLQLEKERQMVEEERQGLEQMLKESEVQITDFNKVKVELLEKLTEEKIKSFGQLDFLYLDMQRRENNYEEARDKCATFFNKFTESLFKNFSVKHKEQNVTKYS